MNAWIGRKIDIAVAVVVFLRAFGQYAEAREPSQAESQVVSAVSAGEERQILTDLFGRWQACRSDISTAKLTYRSFHNSVDGRKSLAEFDALIDSGELDSTPHGLQRFIESMNDGPYRMNPAWGEGVIVVRDAQLRNNLGPFVSIDDRDVSVFHDSLNDQFDAFAASGSNRKPDTLETFRPLPPEPWALEHWRFVGQDAARLRLLRLLPKAAGPPTVDARTYDVERDSGLVSRISRTSEGGKTLAVARYLEFAELQGGVTFPRVAAEAVLKDDVVAVMHVCVVDSLLINVPVDESEFLLPAKANSKIVDHRGVRRNVSRLRQDQPDVVGWLKDHAPGPPMTAVRVPVDHSLRNVLLTGNGLLLMAVGLIFWKKQRASAAS